MADTLNSTLTENTSVQAQITTRTQRNGSQDSAAVDLYAKTTGDENTFSNVHGIQIGQLVEGSSTRGYIAAVTHASRATPFLASGEADIVTKAYLDTEIAAIPPVDPTLRTGLDAAQTGIADLNTTVERLMTALTTAQNTITTLQGQVTALTNTNAQSSEVTSGHVVDITAGQRMAEVDTSTNNPAVKMFNASAYNFTYTSVSNGHTITGFLENGRTVVYHHPTTGEVDITFSHSGTITDANQYIIVESAGG